ncbi:DUF6634 family protein [Pseudotabrizicola formosa]|uniref:DUF6634 family protein n=1 Tax=Pseudotabrizicola formosa TaxID=2030009 RepID=UPI0011AEFF15|nr:DUF6634 family protein [Pseudotabrizicola formosa]
MFNDEFPNPRAPMLNEIEVVRALSQSDPEAYLAKGTLDPIIASFFVQYVQDHVNEPTKIAGRKATIFGDFLDLMERLSTTPPSPAKLGVAPLLARWSAGVMDPTPRLFGIVTGHPRLREGARTFTSPYLQVNPEEGWARTWSRYYKLGDYDPRFFAELILDGVIPSSSGLIDLQISGPSSGKTEH